MNTNKIETNFENYFKLIYRKIRRKQIKFNKTKIIYKSIEIKLPLWVRLILPKEG